MLNENPLVLSLTLSGLQYVRGYRHGLRQPSLLAQVDVMSHLNVSETMNYQISKQVCAQLPEYYRSTDATLTGNPVQRLMDTLVRLVAAMQDSVGLPVVDPGQALRMRMENQLDASSDSVGWFLALPCFAPRAAELALRELLRISNAQLAAEHEGVLAPLEPSQFDKVLDEIAELAPSGTNTHRLLRTALRRQTPMLSLPGGVWQFGWGCNSRTFKSSLSDATSAIGTSWAKDKTQTNQLLKQAGLPVPDQVAVLDVDMALREAKQIGYPVVLKPADLDQGVGVEAGLSSAQDVQKAFARVASRKRKILLEKHVEGQDIRVNIVQGKFRDAIARYPASVTGDGCRSVLDLVAEVNKDPRRTLRRFADMKPIVLNDEALELLNAQGLTESTIPKDGQIVQLRRAANVSSGGYTRRVSDEMHPDNVDLCEQAARLLRLDIAGIDLLIPNHRQSWRKVGGAICEVNAQPQIGLTFPEIYDHLFDTFLSGQGRIPVCFVLCDDMASASRLRDTFVAYPKDIGLRVVWDGKNAMPTSHPSERPTAQAALMDTDTRAVIIMTDGVHHHRHGLPIDRLDLLWIASWTSAISTLSQRLALLLPHISTAEILLDEDLANQIDPPKLPKEFRYAKASILTAQETIMTRIIGYDVKRSEC